jgi:hypothetical protein
MPVRILRTPPLVARKVVPIRPARRDLRRHGASPSWRQAGRFRFGGEVVAGSPALRGARERAKAHARKGEVRRDGTGWWERGFLLAGFGAAATHFHCVGGG